MLKVDNLTFEVNEEGRKRCLVNHISFEVKDGEMLVITGPNGGGKSTLAKVLAGIEDANGGEIFLNEENITGYDIDQSNTYPRLYPGNEAKGTVSGIANGSNNYYPQSRYLTDMSYLRLKNVTVGYTLPKEWTRKAFIEKARIYFSGSNLFLLYKGSDLPVDPEISTGDGLTYGGWGRTTPITRTFSFGIQVTL